MFLQLKDELVSININLNQVATIENTAEGGYILNLANGESYTVEPDHPKLTKLEEWIDNRML